MIVVEVLVVVMLQLAERFLLLNPSLPHLCGLGAAAGSEEDPADQQCADHPATLNQRHKTLVLVWPTERSSCRTIMVPPGQSLHVCTH